MSHGKARQDKKTQDNGSKERRDNHKAIGKQRQDIDKTRQDRARQNKMSQRQDNHKTITI